MAISKQKIMFDSGNPSENDLIGAYIVNASLVVTASQLDIDDLDYTVDSVTAHQGGTWDIGTLTSITNDVNIADGGNSITVDAVQLDIDDLVYTSDSVTAYQGGSWTVSLTEDVTNGAIKNSAASVTNSAAQVLASPLAGRTSVIIQNLGDKEVYIGFDGTVSSSNGLQLPKYSNVELQADANAAIYMIAASGTQDVRFLEIKK